MTQGNPRDTRPGREQRIHRRVCCSLPKALLFSSSGGIKLRLLSLGIKSLEMVAGRPAVPGREGSGWLGTPRSLQGEERSRLPLHRQRRFGVQRRGKILIRAIHETAASAHGPQIPPGENSPKQPTREANSLFCHCPLLIPGARGQRGQLPLAVPGPGPLGSSSSQAHTGSQVRRAGPAASRRDVVFSHSPAAGPSGSGTLRGFGSHTGCH